MKNSQSIQLNGERMYSKILKFFTWIRDQNLGEVLKIGGLGFRV